MVIEAYRYYRKGDKVVVQLRDDKMAATGFSIIPVIVKNPVYGLFVAIVTKFNNVPDYYFPES